MLMEWINQMYLKAVIWLVWRKYIVDKKKSVMFKSSAIVSRWKITSYPTCILLALVLG